MLAPTALSAYSHSHSTPLPVSWRVPLLVAAAITTGLWLVIVVIVSAKSSQPRVVHAPATSEFGPEPPALACMLCSGFKVGGDAAAATVLDLAARHVIDLEEVGPELSLCRIRKPGAPDLTPYERRVLAYLEAMSSKGVVPPQALAGGAAQPQAGGGVSRARSSLTPVPAGCPDRGGALACCRVSRFWRSPQVVSSWLGSPMRWRASSAGALPATSPVTA